MLKIDVSHSDDKKNPHILLKREKGEYQGLYKLDLNTNTWMFNNLESKKGQKFYRYTTEDERVTILEDLSEEYLSNLVFSLIKK